MDASPATIMARPRSTNNNLPPRLAAIRAKGSVYYYYDLGADKRPRFKPLGKVYVEAIRQWAELEGGNAKRAAYSFDDMALRYETTIIPELGARTQIDYLAALKKLREFFSDATLADIQPIHVAQFREWRKAKTQANRNIAVLSSMWNYAREWGMTDRANPCVGVKRNDETGRDVYLTDEQVASVAAHGPRTLQLAIELAYLTGQRPDDVVRMRGTDIRDGYIEVRQGKTRTPIRIAVVGRLAELIAECGKAKASSKVVSTALVVGAHGKPISVQWLSVLWRRARESAGITDDIQFRDLRAKAVSDKEESTGNIRDAQALAGHSTVSMTEHYSRKRRGQKVDPTR